MSIIRTRDESPEIISNTVLLIEGNDEIKFFNALLSHMGMTPDIEVQTRSVRGKDNFRDELPAFLNDPNFSRVTAYAIIRDADTDAANALRSIKDLLRENQQPCPESYASFAYNNDYTLKVGIFIIPGDTPGMLEDLCLQSISNHSISPYVTDFIAKVNETMGDQAPRNQSKAKVQAFLSGMHKTVPHLGVAAMNHYWPFDHEAFDELRYFMEQLVLPNDFG
jgi:hypothetical protein